MSRAMSLNENTWMVAVLCVIGTVEMVAVVLVKWHGEDLGYSVDVESLQERGNLGLLPKGLLDTPDMQKHVEAEAIEAVEMVKYHQYQEYRKEVT